MAGRRAPEEDDVDEAWLQSVAGWQAGATKGGQAYWWRIGDSQRLEVTTVARPVGYIAAEPEGAAGGGPPASSPRVTPRRSLCDARARHDVDEGLQQHMRLLRQETRVDGEERNDEHALIWLGNDRDANLPGGDGTGRYYCGRFLGTRALPFSDGFCGPFGGPQCPSCQRAQAALPAPRTDHGAPLGGPSPPLGKPGDAARTADASWASRVLCLFVPTLCCAPAQCQGAAAEEKISLPVVPSQSALAKESPRSTTQPSEEGMTRSVDELSAPGREAENSPLLTPRSPAAASGRRQSHGSPALTPRSSVSLFEAAGSKDLSVVPFLEFEKARPALGGAGGEPAAPAAGSADGGGGSAAGSPRPPGFSPASGGGSSVGEAEPGTSTTRSRTGSASSGGSLHGPGRPRSQPTAIAKSCKMQEDPPTAGAAPEPEAIMRALQRLFLEREREAKEKARVASKERCWLVEAVPTKESRGRTVPASMRWLGPEGSCNDSGAQIQDPCSDSGVDQRSAATPPSAATPRRSAATPPSAATPRRSAATPPSAATPLRSAATPPSAATPQRSAATPPSAATPRRSAATPPSAATPWGPVASERSHASGVSRASGGARGNKIRARAA